MDPTMQTSVDKFIDLWTAGKEQLAIILLCNAEKYLAIVIICEIAIRFGQKEDDELPRFITRLRNEAVGYFQ